MQENAQLKGKVAVLKEYAASAEMEVKVNRDTMSRLADEADTKQHYLARQGQTSETLRLVRD